MTTLYQLDKELLKARLTEYGTNLDDAVLAVMTCLTPVKPEALWRALPWQPATTSDYHHDPLTGTWFVPVQAIEVPE